MIIKDASGNVTKYESYDRDQNGKITVTYYYDTSGSLSYYVKHEAFGTYKYSADGKYLGTV